MAKITIDSTYAINAQKLINKIQTDQIKTNPPIIAFIESGRKYDKVLFSDTSGIKTKYFIERSTGDIYGAKSNTIPHFKWFYGNITNCEKWDWSGKHGGVSLTDNTVKLVSEFKDYKYYQKI